MATLQQLDQGRDNNFDLLRFIAATLVIFSHSFLVTGTYYTGPWSKPMNYLDLGGFGVKLFFGVSGYLITKSVFKQPTLNSFVWARFLRIFPGLFGAAIFCAFIIGPICTVLPLHQYFASGSVYEFAIRLATLHNFSNNLPGTFAGGSVNSPIWTLPAELLMYLLVLLFGAAMLAYKKQFKILWAAIPVIIVAAVFFIGIPYPVWYLHYVSSWGMLFVLGGGAYLLRDKIVLNVYIWLTILVVYFILSYLKLPRVIYLYDAFLVYGALLFAYHPKIHVKSFHKLGDYSYGLYIYAFPIQQLVAFKFHALGPLTNFFVSYVLALAVAIPSWYFLEKPMLKLKNLRLFKR